MAEAGTVKEVPTVQEREVIKLVQRTPGRGLVSLCVYHFAGNANWLLTYRPGVVTSPMQAVSLLFAYDDLASAQVVCEQYQARTRVAVEAWRAVTAAATSFPAGVLPDLPAPPLGGLLAMVRQKGAGTPPALRELLHARGWDGAVPRPQADRAHRVLGRQAQDGEYDE
jgi:hypothetical protein